ncbi:hypothetical protein GUJ93_ZPchr0009g1001 [Zizania palustris]|uniref:Uncharacterized protein n=1 Tax=Zizania palustris TaxID=103762 RepID=A0A8J5RQA5_ZIZPA|nr:hypothetical protein GUJ93_ZPchr0009g1001 [Zizania palustris]
MDIDAPLNTKAIDDGTKIKHSEAEAEVTGSESRVMASEVEVVVSELASTGPGFEGSQAYEIDFRGIFEPSEYAEISPIEEVEGSLAKGKDPITLYVT